MKTRIARTLSLFALSALFFSPLAFAQDTDGDMLSDADELNIYHTLPNDVDTDDDVIDDGDEVMVYHTNPLVADTDGDGLDDGEEVNVYYSNPRAVDTDLDGVNDGDEAKTYKTSLIDVDTDRDGLNDGVEVMTYFTNPIKFDTDGDGLNDGMEVYAHHSKPTVIDTDGDGLGDAVEVNAYHTDPTDTDSNDDGLNDKVDPETYNTSPHDTDTDGDGLVDRLENTVYHTNPILIDTDSDGLNDGMEVHIYLTNPLLTDTDGDTLSDSREVNAYYSDPTNSDTDGDTVNDLLDPDTYNRPLLGIDTDNDGLVDGLEIYVYHTDPLAPDTDGDGLNDGPEVAIYFSDPADEDTDGDGLTDGYEVNIGNTDPLVPDDQVDDLLDTDSDGVSDAIEINLLHTDPTRAFDMQPGTSTIPFTSTLVSGSYEGLVYDPASGLSLKQKLTISTNGSFTASVMGLARDATYKGKFTSLGEASILINRDKLVSVQMNVEQQDSGDYYIHGVFTTKMDTKLYFELHRSSYSRTNPYPHPGKVTFAASLDTALAGPEGHAVATGEIRSDGTVIFTAYLPDGTVGSYSGPIVKGNLINFYTRSTARSRTTLIGVLVIQDIPATSDFDGTVRLFSTVESGTSIFPLGFDQVRSLEGSYYTPPSAGTLPLPNFAVAPNNALYRWIGGNFGGVDKVGTWSTDGRMVIPSTPIDSARATFTSGSGLLTLSYTRNNAPSKVSAVVLQKSKTFKGYYTSSLSASDFAVEPNP